MERFADWIIAHRKTIIWLFSGVSVVCAVLFFFVTVNYNMVDYLPPDAQSTKALALMQAEFTQPMPNASAMVKGVTPVQALEYKQRLKALEGVSQVIWLDDMVDIKQPLEVHDAATVADFYKEGNALFSLTIDKGMEKQASESIRALIGEENALAGEAPDLATVQQATVSEVLKALAILLPAIVLILILSSGSWLEPLLFLATIAAAILINMGTNVFLPSISFMTNSISPILQLAVSLDYSIFLLHSFADNRKKYATAEEAMRQSIKTAFTTVAASALTTLFGFLALAFMNFQIGADLGLNLAKGIVLSFISAMVFLPALTLCTYKFIDKTAHRPLMPSFQNVNRVLSKIAFPAVVAVCLFIVPAFLGQGQTAFTYGNAGVGASRKSGQESEAIKAAFGQSTVMALIVPRSDAVKEKELSEALEQLEHVNGVMSYANAVSITIPADYLPQDIVNQFYSQHYARIIVYTDTAEEGDEAFATVEAIQATARRYYGDDALSLGQSANLYDMKQLVKIDNQVVNWIAIISIFLVLLFTFKSATLPFILLITIEAGIWLNLAIPYFAGVPINFIGYLVLSTVQLGATVDYAILLTDHYMRHRQLLPKKQAIGVALGETFKSILVSASTLAIAGFVLAATSQNPMISGLGMLLGRGTIFSFLMVVCFLPAMLRLFDKPIGKTTIKANFLTTDRVLTAHHEEG